MFGETEKRFLFGTPKFSEDLHRISERAQRAVGVPKETLLWFQAAIGEPKNTLARYKRAEEPPKEILKRLVSLKILEVSWGDLSISWRPERSFGDVEGPQKTQEALGVLKWVSGQFTMVQKTFILKGPSPSLRRAPSQSSEGSFFGEGLPHTPPCPGSAHTSPCRFGREVLAEPGRGKGRGYKLWKFLRDFITQLHFHKYLVSTIFALMSTTCGNRRYWICNAFANFPTIRCQSTCVFPSHDF